MIEIYTFGEFDETYWEFNLPIQISKGDVPNEYIILNYMPRRESAEVIIETLTEKEVETLIDNTIKVLDLLKQKFMNFKRNKRDYVSYPIEDDQIKYVPLYKD